MTHYMSVVASLAIRRSPASTQPVNLLLIPARTNAYPAIAFILLAVGEGLMHERQLTAAEPRHHACGTGQQ